MEAAGYSGVREPPNNEFERTTPKLRDAMSNPEREFKLLLATLLCRRSTQPLALSRDHLFSSLPTIEKESCEFEKLVFILDLQER